MLHNKNLQKNPWVFQDIEWRINWATETNELADVIARYREEISFVLNENEAEWHDDEVDLKKLVDRIEDKKNNILKPDLWKSVPCHINLSDNVALTTFWKKIIASGWNHSTIDTSGLTTDTKKNELLNKVAQTLKSLQFIHDDRDWNRENWQLFGWESTNMADIGTTLSDTRISQLLEATTEWEVKSKLDVFIESVKKTWGNAFHIQHSKLNDLHERETSIRIAWYLYMIFQIINKNCLTNDLYNEINKALDEQIIPHEIPKIKWLHNAKKELELLKPEYETLKDLNVKAWNVDLGEKDLWWGVVTESRDLKTGFENGIAVWLENYKINTSSINARDADWNPVSIILNDGVRDLTNALSADIRNTKTADILIDVWGARLKIWKFAIDNQTWAPKLIVKFDDEWTIKANATAVWLVLPKFPLDFSFDLKWTKKVDNKLKKSFACLTKKYSIKLKMDWIIPPPPPPPGPITAKEWSATISSVENVHSEEAAYLAEEKDREAFDKLWELSLFKLSTWHPWERVKHFMSREYKRNKAIKKHMQAVKGRIDIRRESVVSAANRHELQNSDDLWRGPINKIISHENADVNRLCVTYLKTDMKDADFEREFNDIIANDPIIEPMIKNNDMNYLWSNILLKLKQEKAEQIMMDKIWKLLVKDINATVLEMKSSYDEATFKAELQKISDEYFDATKSNFPTEIRNLLEVSYNKDLMLPIIQNWKAQLQANVKNLRMQLQLLDNTTWAYEIDNKDKEKSLWQRFWNWMDNHRILTIWGSALAWTWLLYVWSSIVWWPVGAWLATGLLALKMWVITAAKKASHYTKEQKGQEKRLTHGLNIEKQNMENIRKVMNWAPWYSWRRYKAKRQYQLYQEATQHKIADTEYLTKKIQSVLKSTLNLDAVENKNERDVLEWYLVNALVRLDYYKECWHNFVASQNRTKIEQDFNILYQAVQDGVFRLNEAKLSSTNPRKKVIEDWIEDIRTGDPRYSDLHDALERDYEISLSTFKKRRWSLERRYWITSAFIYGWSALLLQYILWSWVWWHHVKTINYPPTSSSTLHEEVKSSLASNGVSPSQISAIESSLKSVPTSWWTYNPEAFWTIVKNETWWTDVQLNDWVSKSFMKDVLRKLNEWWSSEFKNALLSGHINTLKPGDPLFVRAESFLSSPRIWILKPWEWSTVLKNLQDYLSWKPYTSFSPDMRVKMWHFGHMAIHNDIGMWSRLTEEVLDTVTTPWRTITKVRDKRYFFDGIGMPFYANTYRKKLVPKDEEKWVMLENSDPGEIPEGDELITADPTETTWWPSSVSAPSWL